MKKWCWLAKSLNVHLSIFPHWLAYKGILRMTFFGKGQPTLDGCKMKWPMLTSVLSNCPYPSPASPAAISLPEVGRGGLTGEHFPCIMSDSLLCPLPTPPPKHPLHFQVWAGHGLPPWHLPCVRHFKWLPERILLAEGLSWWQHFICCCCL